jgi:hypothetical protein
VLDTMNVPRLLRHQIPKRWFVAWTPMGQFSISYVLTNRRLDQARSRIEPIGSRPDSYVVSVHRVWRLATEVSGENPSIWLSPRAALSRMARGRVVCRSVSGDVPSAPGRCHQPGRILFALDLDRCGLSISLRSSPVRSTSVAFRFSSKRLRFVVPGIGPIQGFCANGQAHRHALSRP